MIKKEQIKRFINNTKTLISNINLIAFKEDPRIIQLIEDYQDNNIFMLNIEDFKHIKDKEVLK